MKGERMNELALFTGVAGGVLGGKLLGWHTVCAVENEPYAIAVLTQRQNDGILPSFPIWDDVRTFDGKPWRGHVDVVSGGFPCVDISCAGKGAGITGEHSGLWSEMARIVGEVRPRFVFVENSPLLTSRGLDRVLSDLAALGFDATWGVIGAHHAGAPHKRDRVWILANSTTERLQGPELFGRPEPELQRIGDASWWEVEPDVDRVVERIPHQLDRTRAIGNAQVPACVALAWRTLAGMAND
jgi:DNA (cytosine-5)-methyltransferase 1